MNNPFHPAVLPQLFFLNVVEASRLLPAGDWAELFRALHVRLPKQPSSRTQASGNGEAEGGSLHGRSSHGEGARPVNGSGGLGSQWGGRHTSSTSSPDGGPATGAWLQTWVHWGVGLVLWLLLWVPMQGLIVTLVVEAMKASSGEVSSDCVVGAQASVHGGMRRRRHGRIALSPAGTLSAPALGCPTSRRGLCLPASVSWWVALPRPSTIGWCCCNASLLEMPCMRMH